MSVRDGLLNASFRGVPFYLLAHDAALGRRVHLHEFPLRDTPFAEDLGRKSRAFSLDALVLGADYFGARNALMAAAEATGPGQLVHPYLGEMVVACTGCKLREGVTENGMARLTLEFVEAGAARFPTEVVGLGAAVVAKADYAAAAVQANFERRHAVSNRPAFVANASGNLFKQALAGIQAAVALVRGDADEVAALQRDVDAAKRDLVALIYTPASAAQALVSSIRHLVRGVATAPADALSLARTLYRFGALLPEVAPSTTSRRAQAVNQAQLLQLVRLVAAAEGARAITGVAFDSYQDAVAARDDVVDTLDAAMLADDVADEVYDALRGLRAAVVRDVAARGANLARLVTYTPGATRPVLMLAQVLFADGGRADELLARNASIRHPLFVPGARPLEVLSDGA